MVQIQILHLPVLKETRQSHTIVRQILLFSNDYDTVFASLGIQLCELLSGDHLVSQSPSATTSEDEHERNPNHPQPDNNDILPLALRQRVLLSVFFRMVTVDRRLAGHHPWRRLGPRHL